jgi:hypothetical protein
LPQICGDFLANFSKNVVTEGRDKALEIDQIVLQIYFLAKGNPGQLVKADLGVKAIERQELILGMHRNNVPLFEGFRLKVSEIKSHNYLCVSPNGASQDVAVFRVVFTKIDVPFVIGYQRFRKMLAYLLLKIFD